MELAAATSEEEQGTAWNEADLLSVANVIDCKHVTPQFTPAGFPLVSIGEVKGRKVDLSEAKRTTKAWFDRLSEGARHLRPGDIVMSRNATVGQVAIVPPGVEELAMGQDVSLIRPIPQKVTTAFLYSALSSPATQRQIIDAFVGSTFKRINVKQIKSLRVPCPPVPEQIPIAEALTDADALIESLEHLIEKKRRIKAGAMQELLTGKRRMPGFEEDWIDMSLGELANVEKGVQIPESMASTAGPYPHLNGGILPSGFAIEPNTDGNTITISEGGNSCGYVQLMAMPFWCGGHCYRVKPKAVDNAFLLHALKQSEPRIMGMRVGSGLPNVQKTALLSLELRLPERKEEQQEIASVVSAQSAEVAALDDRLAKARQIKEGMMQELLTGRIRLV